MTIGWFTAFLCLALLWGSPVAAAEYELWVAGIRVTDANCNDFSGLEGVTVVNGGEFKYDPGTSTLTMKDVTVSVGANKNAIWNKGIKGLKIVVSGTNSLEASSFESLSCGAATTIEGNGLLSIVSSSKGAVFVNSTLTINDITLEATGKYGIGGFDGKHGETLIIENATVTAKGTKAAIADLKTVTLEGCQIIAPKGATWKAEKKAVVDAGGNKAKEVKIEPIVKYDLIIAGTYVLNVNCNTLKDITGVTVAKGGEFKYDPASKKLTMKDVTVSVGDERRAITNRGIEGLEIVVSGTNRLKSTEWSALFCAYSTNTASISGDGTLNVVSDADDAVNIGKNLTISGITLEASGKYGITGVHGTVDETLTLKNAKVTAKGTDGAIVKLANLVTEGCEIIYPVGGKFDKEKHAVIDADGNIAKEVKIEPVVQYGLYIAGTQVTDANCNALKDIKGVTVASDSEFKYDPKKNTLTMKGVAVSNENGQAILNKIEGLKIRVLGTNSLKTIDDATLACRTSTEIEGNGSLTVETKKDAAIFANGTTITISNITLEATGGYGIAGKDGNQNEKLILKNAKVTATGTEAGIADLASCTIENCKMVAPVDGKFNEEQHAVVDAQGNKAKEVKIEKEVVVAVTGVKVTPTTVDLKVKETQQLTISVEPDEATNKNYTCESNNESVATVDKTGLVTAIGAGTAEITITTEDGGKTVTCTVNVSEGEGGGGGTPSFALSETTLYIDAAGATLSINVTSDKAWTLDYDSSVTWLKASPKTGAGSGAVTFTVEKNEATTPRSVVVTFKQAETEKELQLTITQETTASAHVPLLGISFEEPSVRLKVGTSATLLLKYNPTNATNKKVTWVVTEGAASLSVDENGKITATNVAGIAKVRATSEDGSHTAECTITVTTEDVPVESIAVSPAVVNLTVEGTQKLSVSVKPRTATNKTATWAVTSGTDIVSVDGTGLVRALKEGTATVTATVGGKTATCTVNVKAKDAPIAPLAVEDAVLASVVVAPNPFTSQLRIVNPEGLALRYELVTLTGNVVRAGALDGTETMVDTEALPAGLYFVRFYTANSLERSVKVIKY